MLILNNIRHNWELSEFLYTGSIKFNTCQILKGKSGSGKSTLFHILTGLIAIESGTVSWFDKNLFYSYQDETPVAIQYQDNRLFPFLTLKENIRLGWSKKGKLNHRQSHDFLKMSKSLNLTPDKLNLLAGKASGGEQKRASILRALAKARQFNKSIVLFDEPLAALDTVNQKRVARLIAKEQKAFNHTILIASHQKFMWQNYLPLTQLTNKIKITHK